MPKFSIRINPASVETSGHVSEYWILGRPLKSITVECNVAELRAAMEQSAKGVKIPRLAGGHLKVSANPVSLRNPNGYKAFEAAGLDEMLIDLDALLPPKREELGFVFDHPAFAGNSAVPASA
jgi:hypothetical protein